MASEMEYIVYLNNKSFISPSKKIIFDEIFVPSVDIDEEFPVLITKNGNAYKEVKDGEYHLVKNSYQLRKAFDRIKQYHKEDFSQKNAKEVMVEKTIDGKTYLFDPNVKEITDSITIGNDNEKIYHITDNNMVYLDLLGNEEVDYYNVEQVVDDVIKAKILTERKQKRAKLAELISNNQGAEKE